MLKLSSEMLDASSNIAGGGEVKVAAMVFKVERAAFLANRKASV